MSKVYINLNLQFQVSFLREMDILLQREQFSYPWSSVGTTGTSSYATGASEKHRCPYCSYATIARTNLVNHMRTHTGEKPFACTLCPYRSTQKGNLRTHMKNRHEDVMFTVALFDGASIHRWLQKCTATKEIRLCSLLIDWICNTQWEHNVNQENVSHMRYWLIGEMPIIVWFTMTKGTTAQKGHNIHAQDPILSCHDQQHRKRDHNIAVKRQVMTLHMSHHVHPACKPHTCESCYSSKPNTEFWATCKLWGWRVTVSGLEKEELQCPGRSTPLRARFINVPTVPTGNALQTSNEITKIPLCDHPNGHLSIVSILWPKQLQPKFLYVMAWHNNVDTVVLWEAVSVWLKSNVAEMIVEHRQVQSMVKGWFWFHCLKLCVDPERESHWSGWSGSIEEVTSHNSGSKTYHCPLCPYRTHIVTNFKKHMRIHTGEKPFSCPYCPFRTKQKETVKAHIRRHTGEKPFSCPHCPYLSSQKGNLQRHRMWLQNITKPIRRKIDEPNLNWLLHIHIVDCGQLKCIKCCISIGLSSALNKNTRLEGFHFRRFLLILKSVFSLRNIGLSRLGICCKRRHRDIVAKDEFAGHPQQVGADCSSEMMMWRGAPSAGKGLVSGGKIHQCPSCPYSTNITTNLKKHIRTHTGERPFPCPYCPFRAIQEENLKVHIRTHTGEKPYACPHCPFHASKKANLKRHINTHTGVKTLNCKYCPYRCLDINMLNEHLKTHM
nr:zinc finger protein 208-like [Penaeus vannamei]